MTRVIERTSAGQSAASAWKKKLSLRPVVPFGMLVILVAITAIIQPSFFTAASVNVLIEGSALIAILALGQMFVLLVGGIDLSSAAVGTFTAVLFAKVVEPLGPSSVVVVLVAATVIGGVNGWLVAYLQIPSFIVTLGSLAFWQAAALILSDATTLSVFGAGYDLVGWITGQKIGPFTPSVWLTVVLALVSWLMLRYTKLGQSLIAVGLNERAALLAGLQTRWMKILAFALSGLFSGFAGLTVVSGSFSAGPGQIDALLLPAIAAAIIGGCSLTGGIANPLNVLIGSLVLVVLRMVPTAIGLDARSQQIIYGVTVIAAVVATIDRSKIPILK
ncbi:ABC transporter permease [Microbacterium sp. NPDC078428]|uniref:ABC transporter permease n=1 Tax=Microbacterium sp. NPDC078428 TaxID=3364190 RepID=UPI0037C6F974